MLDSEITDGQMPPPLPNIADLWGCWLRHSSAASVKVLDGGPLRKRMILVQLAFGIFASPRSSGCECRSLAIDAAWEGRRHSPALIPCCMVASYGRSGCIGAKNNFVCLSTSSLPLVLHILVTQTTNSSLVVVVR